MHSREQISTRIISAAWAAKQDVDEGQGEHRIEVSPYEEHNPEPPIVRFRESNGQRVSIVELHLREDLRSRECVVIATSTQFCPNDEGRSGRFLQTVDEEETLVVLPDGRDGLKLAGKHVTLNESQICAYFLDRAKRLVES